MMNIQPMHNNSNVKHQLAIVIPAYKSEFLVDALDSIAGQTCKDFTLYIGNDHSPQDLYSIIKNYEAKINIVYKAFDANLGGADLVAHWERCIAMTADEQWIWLFSDDDMMGERCVELFYASIEHGQGSPLKHFDLEVIDQHGHTLKHGAPFPANMPVNEFFTKRIRNQITSTVVEYIFLKEVYFKENGFGKYDLAWCADDAAWIKLGRDKGIQTIAGALVKWRYSGTNISSLVNDKATVLRKLDSHIVHVNWVVRYFADHGITDTSSGFDKLKWVTVVFLFTGAFTIGEKLALINRSTKDLNCRHLSIKAIIYMLYLDAKIRLSAIKDPAVAKPSAKEDPELKLTSISQI